LLQQAASAVLSSRKLNAHALVPVFNHCNPILFKATAATAINAIMGMPGASSKSFQATPPDKGSFPLDHDGEYTILNSTMHGLIKQLTGDCKKFMAAFMACLKLNNQNGRVCRDEAQAYLGCRMDK
jgi:cytochrome c oxidase assembly protein subunit 19